MNKTLTIQDLDLKEALDQWTVYDPGYWVGDGPKCWYAVANNDGIVAYFEDVVDASRFRLAEINRALNG